MRRFRRRLGAATVSVTVLALVFSSATAQANEPQPDALPATINLDGVSGQLTPDMIRAGFGRQMSVPLSLVTGDTVHVSLDADGEPVVRGVEAAPRDHGRTVAFHTFTHGDARYLVPSDALSLVGADVLDWELFNLAKLAEHALQGTVGEVPVIVTHTGGFGARRAPQQVEGTAVERSFDSIAASAVTIDGGGAWWRQVQADAGRSRSLTAGGALTGVQKVWLNELHEVQLDESVPQVGAGVAWDNGYDGAGVTVAVLDTGIDADHPDVAGKVLQQIDFTGNAAGPVDGHGHGTHVAATIAGTGDAADGLRPGVAPGADLIVGKVCSDGGSCPSDAILAGMEWAAQSGAEVVNMSLGGGATDGTDPLSQMVNQLSAAFDTLFVIAAGNSGPGEYTVGAPAAADAALAVAAVDKDDEMADFSSRGPRLGDDALKPDIAAPGVDIVAARAEGTAMGTVVDDYYTTASGTSMATPHVAGGAAIVAQQNPDLSGQELKALLMGTALDLGHDIFAQGAGRMDLARAVDPTVFSDGNVNFGRLEYPHQPVTGALGYINVTEEPVTLSLTGSLTAGDDSPAPDGLFTLGADEVTVPADGTASVEVTIDGSVLSEDDLFGAYRGIVEARDSEGDLRAASRVRVFLEPERHEVVIEVTAPDGAESVSYDPVAVVPMDDQVYLHDDPATVPGDPTVSQELFAGAYAVQTVVTWTDAAGAEHIAVPAAPEVVVDGPTTVELDLNEAERLAVDTGELTETYGASLAIDRVSETAEWGVSTSLDTGYGAEPSWWVLPTGEEVSHGTLNVTSRHALVPPAVTVRAIGGGPPLALDARYATPDVSVPGPTFQWTEGEGDEQVAVTRETLLPVPRLESLRPLDAVYGGAGTAEDLAGADVDGAVVLLTPTDICAPGCDFAQLRERVAAAADAGAVGVIVAGDSGRVRLNGPDVTIICEDGWESCPDVEPYAAAPIVTVPADQAASLVERLQRSRPVKLLVRGDGDVSEAYALSFHTDGRVPGDLPHQVGRGDLDRVEHRFHDDAPSEVEQFGWLRVTPQVVESGDSATLALPRVATQRSMTVLVGPRPDGAAIDRFEVTTAEFQEPYVVAPPGPDAAVNGAEIHDLELSGSDTISWNTGPTVPAAVADVATEDGFVLQRGTFCAGCREGDTFWPAMRTASSNGHLGTGMIGIVNNAGVAEFVFGTTSCEPPMCTIALFDEGGEEIEQTLVPVELVVGGGVPAGDVLPFGAAGGVPGQSYGSVAGAIEKETNQ